MPTASDGWDNEGRVFTTIKNVTKNSKIVLSTLNGIEIGPQQELDLRTCFRKSQVVDAAHEIASLIRTGHLADTGEGAAKGPVPVSGRGMPTSEEMAKKITDNLIRDISSSTSMGSLEDWMTHKNPAIAKAAALRVEILSGKRDDEGVLIPGNEEVSAKPTEMIRSVGPAGSVAVPAGPEPVAAGVGRRAGE